MSVSPGSVGGFGANHHLRQSAVFLGMPMLQRPEMYVGAAAELFDEQGNHEGLGAKACAAGASPAFVGRVSACAP